MADSPAGQSQRLLDDLIALRPGFAAVWAEEGYLWTDYTEGLTACGVFSSFSHYIADALATADPPQSEDVFQFVEQWMSDKDDAQAAAATCFLENLMNRTPDDIKPGSFIPLLGPRSRDVCRELDEYYGTRTEGLW